MTATPNKQRRQGRMSRVARHRLLRWLPALAWMAVIFWFSAQPDLPRPPNDLVNLIVRKAAHFGVFGVLALLYLYGLNGTSSAPAGKRGLALLLALLYAISDEYHQSWTPNRSPMATDVLIDSAGATTALLLWPWIANMLQRYVWHRRAGVRS